MLQRGTRANALEYADERKEAKTMCRRKKRDMRAISFKSFKIDVREMYGNFMKGCVRLRRDSNQE
jgi:hypothetical protein